MRLEQLATRLSILESKVSFLMTGEYTTPASTDNVTAMDIDVRLTLVETTVDMLVAQKTQEVMSSIATSDSSEGTTPSVDAIVSLSPSATFPEASDIVSAVVQSQIELPAIESEVVAETVSTVVTTVITAQPEVVTDSEMMINTILDVLSNQPAIAEGDEANQAIDAVSTIISNIIGEEISEEVKAQIVDAITSDSNPLLDEIEERLNIVESKYITLIGK